MEKVMDRLSEVLEQPSGKYHMLTTIGVVLAVLTFMSASLYVLITSAA
jgi:hypothetical protein